jgi:hypothetical protein
MRLSRIPAETRNAAPPPRPVALRVVVEAISLFWQAGGLPSALFIASLPERVVRSLSALAGGVLREAGEVTIPARLRRTRLYRALAGNTLQFLIEQVGQVEGTYPVGARRCPPIMWSATPRATSWNSPGLPRSAHLRCGCSPRSRISAAPAAS